MTTDVAVSDVTAPPASDDIESPPSTLITGEPEAGIGVEEREGGEGEQDKGVKTPAEAKPRTIEEIRTLVDSGRKADLTFEEGERFSQSETDRKRAEQEQLGKLTNVRREANEALNNLPDSILDVISSEVSLADSEGRSPSETLLKDGLAKTISALIPKLTPALDYQRSTRYASYLIQAGADKAEVDRRFALGQEHLVQLIESEALKRGNPEVAKELAKTKDALDKANAEIQRLVGQRGVGTGASTNGTANSSGARPYSQMTSAERAALTPAQRDAAVRAEYGGR